MSLLKHSNFIFVTYTLFPRNVIYLLIEFNKYDSILMFDFFSIITVKIFDFLLCGKK